MAQKRFNRIAYFLLTIILGSFAMLGITKVNSLTKPTVERFFTKVENNVHTIEQKHITLKDPTERESKMSWFEEIKYEKDSLLTPQHILLGAHDNLSGETFASVKNLENSIESTFPLVHIYTAWGNKDHHAFPFDQLSQIINMGSIPVLTWEPWLTEFDTTEFPGIGSVETRSKNGLTDIADGLYDAYIIEWAKYMQELKYPIFLRWGHEMNDPYRYPWGPHNNSPEEYVAAWQHIYNIFEEENVLNVIWVWNPHISYKGYEAYYPGNEYVDYVGVDVLNFGTSTTWSEWTSFEALFANQYTTLEKFNKPIMIAELGSLALGGDKVKWFKDALDSLPQKYPAVKSVMFFHVSDDKTTTMKSLSWSFVDDSLCTRTIADEIYKWY